MKPIETFGEIIDQSKQVTPSELAMEGLNAIRQATNLKLGRLAAPAEIVQEFLSWGNFLGWWDEKEIIISVQKGMELPWVNAYGFVFFPDTNRLITPHRREHLLQPREGKTFKALALNPGIPLTHQQIFESWGWPPDMDAHGAIRTSIQRLRKIINRPYNAAIKIVHGIGYILGPINPSQIEFEV